MKTNRKSTIKELLKILNYKEWLDQSVLATLKNEGEKEVELEFFKLDKYVSISELQKEYESRNLSPDLGATIQYLIKNPKVLDEKKYIGVQMEDNKYATFSRHVDERGVYVYQNVYDWRGGWWFAGVRKSSETKALGTNSETLPLENFISELKDLIKKYES